MRFHGPSLLFLAASAAAAPLADSESLLTKRANSGFDVVPHDSIKWIPNSIRSGTEGDAIRRYEPYLHIAHGCQSYPAVSATGQVGGGLSNSGTPSGGCDSAANGQTYTRGAWYNGRFAIMYAWYFPKDQIASGLNGGHRHDWESVVIWIDNREYSSFFPLPNILLTELSPAANANPRVFGGAASGHGSYKKTTNPQMRGNRLQVEYFTTFPTNHELQFTNTLGGDFDMIDYDTVSPAIKKAFNEYDWGSANCPFNQAHFLGNLAEAWI
jgi:hypothetical protein